MASQNNSYALLEVIPASERTPEQVACWRIQGEAPTFKLRRDPNNLEELNTLERATAIWRENNTLTYVTPRGNNDFHSSDERSLSLMFIETQIGLQMTIVGTTDKDIAQTAAFFLSLDGRVVEIPKKEEQEAIRKDCPEDEESMDEEWSKDESSVDEDSSFEEMSVDEESAHEEAMDVEESEDEDESEVGTLIVHTRGCAFDFGELGTETLEYVFKVAPSRRLQLQNMNVSKEQSIVLATRPDQICLTFWECEMEDGGKAFVDSLLERQSSFGSMGFAGRVAFHDAHLRRLLQTDKIHNLSLPRLRKDLSLLPFSMKLNRLHYAIALSMLKEDPLHSLNIAVERLNLVIEHERCNIPTKNLVAFFRRVAEAGQLLELRLRFTFQYHNMNMLERLVQELVGAVLLNRNMEVLDLGAGDGDLNVAKHLETLFEGLKHHKGLRTLKLTAEDEAFGEDFSYLRELLSNNRNITVTDEDGRIYSDGASIDELYTLNRFYRGSADLLLPPSLARPSLVATALSESAAKNFQRSALLLSNHADVLHELVEGRYDAL